MGKGSKLLNPADKARKEARKKELKKNKKQRQQVRSAAIESRDPEQVIAELDKIDKLEFNVETNPTFSDSFYKDKRKRLKETLTKILSYYQKEDSEKFDKLKKLERDYEEGHLKLSKEFEGIKAAQEVKIEDIFLPPEQDKQITAIDEIADDDPLLSESVYVTPMTEGQKPPGCPPGLPPDLGLIVDSLKMAVSLSLEMPASLPSHLMNLRLPTTNRGYISMNSARQYDNKNYNKRQIPSRAPNTTRQPQKINNPSKPAVIESKPVLVKTNQTKFVPSSLRTKIKPKQD